MNELNKKMVEFAGIKIKLKKVVNWGHHSTLEYDMPNFPQSLDACFEWLVPGLLKAGYDITLASTSRGFSFIIDPDDFRAEAETPALAFCLAVEKLIDNEKTNKESQ